jgi:hypothetical protein
LLRYPAALHPSTLVSLGGDFLLFGNLAHGLIEQYFQRDDALALADAAFDAWFASAFETLIDQEGALLRMPGRGADLAKFRNRLRRSLQTLRAHVREAGVVKVVPEQALEGSFEGGALAGFADLVMHKSAGEAAIVDMKWSGARKYPDKLKHNRHLQLAIYAELYRQQGGQWPAVAYYILDRARLVAPDDHSFPEAETIASDDGENTAQLWQRFLATWRWRVAQIRAGRFEVALEAIAPTEDSEPPPRRHGDGNAQRRLQRLPRAGRLEGLIVTPPLKAAITFISAGAGSGKTHRLTALLHDELTTRDARPAGVIATTFTRKAATELRERVRAHLLQQGRFGLANAMGQARIGTVNSVCGQLVARFAFEAGLSVEQQVLEETPAALLLDKAIDAALDGPELGELLALVERLGLNIKVSSSAKEEWKDALQTLVNQLRSNDIPLDKLDGFAMANADELLAHFPAVTAQDLDADLLRAIRAALPELETVAATGRKKNTPLPTSRWSRASCVISRAMQRPGGPGSSSPRRRPRQACARPSSPSPRSLAAPPNIPACTQMYATTWR